MEQENLITLDGVECCVLVDDYMDDQRYLYAAEREDGDITGNFYLYKVVGENQYEKIDKVEDLKAILPVIVSMMKDKI